MLIKYRYKIGESIIYKNCKGTIKYRFIGSNKTHHKGKQIYRKDLFYIVKFKNGTSIAFEEREIEHFIYEGKRGII